MPQQIKLCNIDDILKKLQKQVSKSTHFYFDILYDLSTAIFKKRLEMKKSQKEFAKLLDVSQAMISKYESGDYNFTIKQLCIIAEKLNLTPTIKLLDYEYTANNFEYSESDTEITSETENITSLEEAA